jgi:hypothetical protein
VVRQRRRHPRRDDQGKSAFGNTFLLYVGENGKPLCSRICELRLSFRIAGGNAGVQFRSTHKPFKSTDKNKWVVAGYQAEVEDTPGKADFSITNPAGAS